MVLVTALLVSGAPTTAQSAQAKHPLLTRMAEQASELERNLTGKRAAIVKVRSWFDAAAGRRARAEALVKEARTQLTEGPDLLPPSIVESIYGDQGTLTRLVVPLEQSQRSAQRELDAVTSQAADVQGDLLDTERRIKAFETALSGTGRTVYRSNGAVYRFGGPGAAPVSAESIDDYLESKASPLAGHGAEFLESGVKHRVDPRFVVAVAGAESAFGLVTCAPHNAWGWGCPNNPFRFRSWPEGFDTVMAGLRENYIDEGRTTVGEIHLKYAPPAAANDPTGLNYAWPDNVARFLVEQGGNPQHLVGSGPKGRATVGVSS
jgi:hypothetical protein